MKTFKDQMQREWLVEVTCLGLRRIQDSRGVNLADTRNLAGNLDLLRSDDLFVTEAAWELIRPAAEKQGLAREPFLDSMWGDCIDAACKAILEGLSDFFRYPSARSLVKSFAAALGETQSLTSGQQSTGSQESSASTQAA